MAPRDVGPVPARAEGKGEFSFTKEQGRGGRETMLGFSCLDSAQQWSPEAGGEVAASSGGWEPGAQGNLPDAEAEQSCPQGVWGEGTQLA